MLPCAADSILAALWGKDPLHPSSAVYKKMAGTIVDNLRDSGVRYTIPSKRPAHQQAKKAKIDLNLKQC
jgi:hypothetical protein